MELLDRLYQYADEFLIHAVDVEGKASGIERELVELLGSWNRIPVTYAGGIGSFQNLEELAEWGTASSELYDWKCAGSFWRNYEV